MSQPFDIRIDDLSGQPTRNLLALHLRGMPQGRVDLLVILAAALDGADLLV